MSLSRRQFLKSMGSAGIVYAFRFAPQVSAQTENPLQFLEHMEIQDCLAEKPVIDYQDWIAFGPDSEVTIFTCRTELGQGLRTVLTAILTQGLDIPKKRLTIVQGDTSLCPDDGPTTGSASTRFVGWGFWIACNRIQEDLVKRASNSFNLPSATLQYKNGNILKQDGTTLAAAHELGKGELVMIDINPDTAKSLNKEYVDLGLQNVNAKKIVTGRLKFVGDIRLPEILYAAFLPRPYHRKLTKILSANLTAAQAIPGIKAVEVLGYNVAAIGERYTDVLKALNAVDVKWTKPTRRKKLNVEKEIRAGAQLIETKEESGDVNAGLAASHLVVSETYLTQYTSQAPIETDTAVARLEDTPEHYTVWAASQYPFKARYISARSVRTQERNVRVIGMPVGGGFGAKISNPVSGEAALLAKFIRKPVKLIYSRKDQFQKRGSYKAAVLVDLTTGISTDGRILARKINTHQDVGNGTINTYAIPNVLTNLYKAEWPFARAISRGTSFVQNCFATESHIDMVATAAGIDPVQFRRINVSVPAFVPLLDACAEMIGYDGPPPAPDEGMGMAIINHGGHQMGAVAAHVAVDRQTGQVELKRLCGAYDIGTVINHRTAIVGIRGAMTWGIGYALSEEIHLDGHRAYTSNLIEYRIPRFTDIPPMDVAFLDNFRPGSPRGCGEMPVPPTIGAIANAVYQAIGVRFYSTPITPERVLKALY